MQIFFGIIYLFLFLYVVKWAIDKCNEIDRKFDIETRKEKIKQQNTLASDIREFKDEYDTSDKTEEINKFIKGEN